MVTLPLPLRQVSAETNAASSGPAQQGSLSSEDHPPSLLELKRTGLERSRFKDVGQKIQPHAQGDKPPEANLADFQEKVKPLLEQYCVDCHGPDSEEGNFQLSRLDPDLLRGEDTDWWEEVFSVVTKGEMPPPDQVEMGDEDRQTVVNWLSHELEAASILRRQSGSHSAFRRLTRYEYNYALQDLLGLPWDFAKDLPPEPQSEEGFQNSSELLHLSVSQFETYHRLAREALDRATVSGKRPETLYWGISMEAAAQREWAKQDQQIAKAKKELSDSPEELEKELAKLHDTFHQPHGTAYYKNLGTGRTARAEWAYPGARYAFAPSQAKPEFPSQQETVAVLPVARRQNLIVELGNRLPDEGTMRVTVRASRVNTDSPTYPSLQLLFGWQASNEGRALLRVSDEDVPITAGPDNPQIVQWDVPLSEIYPRNSVRKTSSMGAIPSPSEYIRIANSAASTNDVQIDFVQVEAPVYDQWPPKSHKSIFFDHESSHDESAYAKELLTRFMTRAWRRPPTDEEIDRKLTLYTHMRPECETFEEAILEVLATVLSSPQFLYVANFPNPNPSGKTEAKEEALATNKTDAYRLATRLSLFLWSSVPDEPLLRLAESGELSNADVLAEQVERMLNDPRSKRLSQNFVHQWLNLELLEFVNFARNVPSFDPLLKEAMQHEPVALFGEVLQQNASVLDFLHSDYTMVNERLAKHYGIGGVTGNHFRRVQFDPALPRGGLLTQPGVMAMNSDWPDSHPLKRAIWLLECLLADPPPPPPPAVPQIDLADPEIAKMTLKERIEDHRNHAACKSCHVKIDPWGIAFENFDALGKWREKIRGKDVDASSELFNGETLDGIDGLKRFLLENRQDQFVHAMVHKLTTYALGRPLGFEDRADIEMITANVRQEGDGLRTLIHSIVQSDLFQSE
ncbi:DUF1592 domain-containing protein [Bremerella sp. T1]|uniref:DUF1592 domain-containing protein n=1 Tax=Bremerella sp. TYQ1 TaxID=3119568 RepID=UPI001CC9F585|nr:DUF1592 domain-containing protein [Bremerella volcania]UBM37234.1 DUF1592 domain-containing protein [Bremerella volcania]